MAAGKTTEFRILQMYLWSLVTPNYVNGRRIGLLARHGDYDILLIECPKSANRDAEPIWIEHLTAKTTSRWTVSQGMTSKKPPSPLTV